MTLVPYTLEAFTVRDRGFQRMSNLLSAIPEPKAACGQPHIRDVFGLGVAASKVRTRVFSWLRACIRYAYELG